MRETHKEVRRKKAGITGILSRLNNNICSAFINMMREEASNPARQFAIAVVLINPADESEFLAVKRPPNAKTLPNVWGLPAVTVKSNESPEAATARLAKEKLNTQVEFLGCLGFDSMDRGEYELTLMDVVARLVGKQPSVWAATTKDTKYVQQQWTNELTILKEAAIRGSVCSQVLLKSQGIPY